MSGAMEKLVSNVIGSYLDGLSAGEELQQRRIDHVIAAYDAALKIEGVQIPLELANAMEALRGQMHIGTPAELPRIEMVRGCSSTEYRLVGSLDSVLGGVKGLFLQFPALGYGTQVYEVSQEMSETYVARLTKRNSCD